MSRDHLADVTRFFGGNLPTALDGGFGKHVTPVLQSWSAAAIVMAARYRKRFSWPACKPSGLRPPGWERDSEIAKILNGDLLEMCAWRRRESRGLRGC